MFNSRTWGDTGSSQFYGARSPPSAYATPARTECFGLTPSGGGCTAAPASQGFCSAHQEQAMWLDPRAAHITAAQRRRHAEGRRCCGLTKKYELCRNNPGGNWIYCYLHGRQAAYATVGAAPGPEAPQRAVVRERMREFWRVRGDAEARDQDARDRWARQEQRRREEERARDEREQEERRRAREEQRHRQEERERQSRQEEEDRARQERSRRERDWNRRSRQRQRPRPRNGGQGTHQTEEERRRDQERAHHQQEQARERDRQARQDQDPDFRARCLQRYLDASKTFDSIVFSASNPNRFSLIPWPVIPPAEGMAVGPEDITRENVNRFFAHSSLRGFKTIREIDVILKNTARRFHPDRFSENRAVVASIRDVEERRRVMEAAEVVIKTVNACRGG